VSFGGFALGGEKVGNVEGLHERTGGNQSLNHARLNEILVRAGEGWGKPKSRIQSLGKGVKEGRNGDWATTKTRATLFERKRDDRRSQSNHRNWGKGWGNTIEKTRGGKHYETERVPGGGRSCSLTQVRKITQLFRGDETVKKEMHTQDRAFEGGLTSVCRPSE